MPYTPAHLVLQAVDAIEGAHALAIVTLPSLLREAKALDVDPTVSQIPYGGGVEEKYLKDYFELAGAPDPDKPYRAIWSARTPWQTRKYPGGGLQRQRGHVAGRGEVLIQRKPSQTGLSGDVWGLTQTAGAELLTRSRKVRLIDLALWIGRDVDTATIASSVLAGAGLTTASDDIDKLDAWFKSEFEPGRGDLIGTIYEDVIPAEYRAIPFAPAPIADETYQELGVLPPAPTVNEDLRSVVGRLEQRIVEDGFELPDGGLVRRVLTAWLRGDLVVLVGQPGTGKTMFASLLGQAMEAEFELESPLMIPVRADFDEAELIGYERLDGTVHLQDFARAVLLDDAPLEARVVIFEEFNLAAVETYLSAVLVATQERERVVRLPSGESTQLPIDTFIIATCNSFRDEPETRTRVSSPTKRRATTITMPNVLGDRYEEDPDTAVTGIIQTLIANERARVEARESTGRAAQFDSLRLAALRSVSDAADFTDEAHQALVAVSNAILDSTAGRSWFTLGILRDVVMSVVMAERDAESELTALGNAVADKLVHQVRGAHADVHGLLGASSALPNAQEIGRLIEQTMSGPSDELLPLL